MSRIIYSLVFAIGLLSNTAVAQKENAPSTGARVVSFPELAKELTERNPEIQAARYHFEAATKRPSQLGSLPDPKVSVTNFGVGHPFSELNGSNFAYQGFGVTQEFPFPGKLALASDE